MKEKKNNNSNEKQGKDFRLSQFMAIVSHDLKTPLNAVVGFSSLLVRDTEAFPPEASHQLGMIDKNARKLLLRLDTMVEFFRLRAGLIAKSAEWLKPRELIMKICEEQSEVQKRQKNTLHLDEKSFPTRIHVVRMLFSRVMSELISNAVKYTYNGNIKISAKLSPGSQAGLTKLDLSVSDTGSSLSQEVLTKLCLSLGLNTTDDWLDKRTIFEGLGLGLAIAREASNQMGGWIMVGKNQHGESRFSLMLELPEDSIEH